MPGLLQQPNGWARHRIGVHMKRTAVGLLLVVSALALLLPSSGPAALAQGAQRVGLVVKFDDGSVFTECIEFSQPEITGCEALDLSSLSVEYGGYGSYGQAVCSINGVGCPASNCFCQCTGADCEYWAYYHLAGGKWEYSTAGCSSHSLHHGDVDGWAWGAGTIGATSEVEPPLMTFEELCAPPTATPTRTPRPSPPVVEFTADPEDIVAGGCSTIRWMVDNGELVALDGEGVRPDDARYVCLSETQTFELLVLNAAGEFDYELTITVRQPTATPYPTATQTSPPTPTSGETSPPSPPSETPITEQPKVSPSPPPTGTPMPPSTPRPTVVAMLSTATPAEPVPQNAAIAQPTIPATASEEAPDETVGLDRILLLLGVGAGTLGFGTVAFAATVILLLAIYFRARAQF